MKFENKIAVIAALTDLASGENTGKALNEIALLSTGEDATPEDQAFIATLVEDVRPDIKETFVQFQAMVEASFPDADAEFKREVLFTMMDLHYGKL